MTAAGHTHVRRIALGAMMALACAASVVLLNEVHVGPAWVHWTISVVALAAALGVLVVADLSWERAVAAAEADGLVVGPDAKASKSPRASTCALAGGDGRAAARPRRVIDRASET